MIRGIGTDIVEVRRVEQAVEQLGTAFLNRVYTPAEQQYAGSHGAGRFGTLAGRWAMKEAVSKALGCGIGEHCSMTDVEILPENDGKRGRPAAVLSGRAAEFLKSSGGGTIHVSLSHEKDYAVGFAVWEQN